MILAQKIAGGRGKRSYHHRRDEKRANLEANRSRYRQAECAGKSKISDEFCIVCLAIRASMPSTCGHITVGDLCRQLGVNEGPFYLSWRKKDAHLGK